MGGGHCPAPTEEGGFYLSWEESSPFLPSCAQARGSRDGNSREEPEHLRESLQDPTWTPSCGAGSPWVLTPLGEQPADDTGDSATGTAHFTSPAPSQCHQTRNHLGDSPIDQSLVFSHRICPKLTDTRRLLLQAGFLGFHPLPLHPWRHLRLPTQHSGSSLFCLSTARTLPPRLQKLPYPPEEK